MKRPTLALLLLVFAFSILVSYQQQKDTVEPFIRVKDGYLPIKIIAGILVAIIVIDVFTTGGTNSFLAIQSLGMFLQLLLTGQ